jgi:hypothetical protein
MAYTKIGLRERIKNRIMAGLEQPKKIVKKTAEYR